MKINQWMSSILIAIIWGLGCDSPKDVDNQTNEDNDKVEEVVENYFRPHPNYQMQDTLMANGTFLKFHAIDSLTFGFKWGNQFFEKTFRDSFECFGQGNDFEFCDATPKIELINDDFIALKVGLETPRAGSCSFITHKCIFLPLSEEMEVFERQLFIKFEDKYIISTNEVSFSVENIETWESQKINFDPKPFWVFKTLQSSFDTIYIENKYLNMTYTILSDDSDEEEYISKKVRLKI